MNRRVTFFLGLTAVFLLLIKLSYGSDFHFGAVGYQIPTYDRMTGAHLDSMKNQLGFNAFAALAAWPEMLDFMDDSLALISNMYTARGVKLTSYFNYYYANYALVEAESTNYEISFSVVNGGSVIGGFVYGPTDSPGDTAVFLDSLWYKHETGTDVGQLYYFLKLYINFDTDSVNQGDTLGFLRLRTGNWWSDPGDNIVTTFYITADTALNDTTYELELGNIKPLGIDYIQIATLQRSEFAVDYFKVYNEKGQAMVERGEFIQDILSHASNYSDHILFWYLRDEPQFLHWKPYSMILDSLNSCSACSTGNSIFAVSLGMSPRDFLQKVNPPFLWLDAYPLSGGQECIISKYYIDDPDTIFISSSSIHYTLTKYTGTDGPEECWRNSPHGLQYDLDSIYVRKIDSCFKANEDYNKEIWLSPPAFSWHYIDCWKNSENDTTYYYDYDDGTRWREPTKSELICVTFLGMCYDLDGIMYWCYDSYYDDNGTWQDRYNRGIIDTSGILTNSWFTIRDDINPYIKAIDSTYLSLTWDTAYAVNPASAFPNSDLIDTIRAYSTSPDSNPDLGWFQVGEFYDDAGTHYFMLVNRACSQGPDDPTEAPPVTAIVTLNRSYFNNAERLLVIDIAHEVDSSWNPIPETTYTTIMPDSNLYFTTVLKAGEGRLFKIAY